MAQDFRDGGHENLVSSNINILSGILFNYCREYVGKNTRHGYGSMAASAWIDPRSAVLLLASGGSPLL